MSDLLTEVPKPLYALRARLVECYKFYSDERLRLQKERPTNEWNIFGPDEEDERREQEREQEDTKLWAKMEGFREAITLVDVELENIVREHLVMVPVLDH